MLHFCTHGASYTIPTKEQKEWGYQQGNSHILKEYCSVLFVFGYVRLNR